MSPNKYKPELYNEKFTWIWRRLKISFVNSATDSFFNLISELTDIHIVQTEDMEEVVMVMGAPTDMAEEVIHKLFSGYIFIRFHF